MNHPPMAFNINEAANELRMSPSSIRRLISKGVIQAARLNRRVIIPRQSLEEALEYGVKRRRKA